MVDSSLVGVLHGPIIVNADDHTGSTFFQNRDRSSANWTSNRHDDVCAFVKQGFAHGAAVIGAFEVAGEESIAGSGVPTKGCDCCAVNFVVEFNTQNKSIHEDFHGRNLDATVGGDNASLGHSSGQVASQESGLIDGKAGPVQVVGCEPVDIDDTKHLISVRASSSGCGVTQQEADGHDQIAAFLKESIDVGFIISLLLGFEVFGFNAEVCNGVFHAFPGGGVEGFVINASDVGDLAGQEYIFNCR